MKMRREPAAPASPPAVGRDEVVLDEQGQLFYRDKDGQVVPLRPYRLAIGQFVQDGFATVPTGTWLLNELGAGGSWSRTSAGVYVYTFTSGVLSEDYGIVFGSLESTSAARLFRVNITDPVTLGTRFEDASGVAVEADCVFNVMILNFVAPVV